MASIGYGYTRAEFLCLAFDWAVTLGRKKQSDPDFAASWYKGFKRRNPDVTLAKPQKLSVLRVKCTSDETMDKYFCELAKVLKKHDLENHPEFIWNVDETGLMMEHNPGHVICMKGTTPQAITSNRGKTVTIIASGSEAGIRLPPYYVFPGMRWNQDLLTGASPGSAGTVTESGWSNSAVFMEYLEQYFLKHVSTKDHPVMILFEGHKSHVNLTLSTWGEANNVVFFVLPPHTSHVTQPLDIGCFGPLKNIYHSECQAYMRRNPGMQINRCNIAEISSKEYNRGVCAENLISAFKKTGVYPLQRTSIGAAKTTPSTIYNENKEQPISEPAESVSFLESKKILKVLEKTKGTRKRKPTIMGDISSPSKKLLMTPVDHPKKIEVNKKDKKGTASEVPGPSGEKVVPKKNTRRVNKAPLSPIPGPSGDSYTFDSEEDSHSEIAEEDLCCVCGKFTPEPMNLIYTLELVQWGQCDKCGHWTYLKYCCDVKFLWRHDEFLCHHCV